MIFVPYVSGIPMKVAELVIVYRMLRDYDPEKGYYCYPKLEEARVWVNPKYKGRGIVKELEWDAHTDSSTTFSRTESVTEVQLGDGEWLSVWSLELMHIYSNAAPLGTMLVETCPTGVVEYDVELNTIDDEETIEYLNREYGNEEDNVEPISIEDYLMEFVNDWMNMDENLSKLEKEIFDYF